MRRRLVVLCTAVLVPVALAALFFGAGNAGDRTSKSAIARDSAIENRIGAAPESEETLDEAETPPEPVEPDPAPAPRPAPRRTPPSGTGGNTPCPPNTVEGKYGCRPVSCPPGQHVVGDPNYVHYWACVPDESTTTTTTTRPRTPDPALG